VEAPGPDEQSIVDLPAGADGPFEVFVNGVRQQPGADFDQVGRSLVFRRRLAREGKLGFWRWSSIFFGVAGTYKKNDPVDLVYSVGERRIVAPLTPRVEDSDPTRPA
jgi:hypothetical protein